jgi:hypothetical protein
MSDGTRIFQGTSPELLARIHIFERAYSNWHTKRADMYDNNLPNDDTSCNTRTDEYDAAEMELLITPAPMPWCLWLKWEALDRIVTNEGDGMRGDKIVTLALAAIKTDLLNLGIKSPGE